MNEAAPGAPTERFSNRADACAATWVDYDGSSSVEGFGSDCGLGTTPGDLDDTVSAASRPHPAEFGFGGGSSGW
jgi:hypothetical protein